MAYIPATVPDQISDIKEREKILFRCNDKYELRIWMDLNGFKTQDCKIFYNKDQMIEYASILLRKTRDEI